MTFKRRHLEGDFTEAHYDCMLPDQDPPPSSRPLARHIKWIAPSQHPTPPVCAQVFAIAELAEQIFLHLPPETLLCRAQRVCAQWHRCIRESEPIQQYLFFKPIGAAREVPQPRDRQPRAPGELDSERHGCDREATDKWSMGGSILENPWLYLFSSNLVTASRLHCRPEASWRGMLVRQPPGRDANGAGGSLGDLTVAAKPSFPQWHRWEAALGWEAFARAKKVQRTEELFVEMLL